jgi:hypothetical protein
VRSNNFRRCFHSTRERERERPTTEGRPLGHPGGTLTSPRQTTPTTVVSYCRQRPSPVTRSLWTQTGVMASWTWSTAVATSVDPPGRVRAARARWSPRPTPGGPPVTRRPPRPLAPLLRWRPREDKQSLLASALEKQSALVSIYFFHLPFWNYIRER